jgi:nitroreductase
MQALGTDEVQDVVAEAALAPSVHNSQPWRFRWDGASLVVLEDLTRSLPVIDPVGRERVISCGAAALNARTALRGRGHGCTVELLADQGEPALVARLVPGVATPPTPDETLLALAIARRHTERGVFDQREVAIDVVARLRTAAEAEGAWLHVVQREQEQLALAVLLSHAEQAQHADPDYQAELQAWRTRELAEQGIPDAAVVRPVGERGSNYTLRDFDAGSPVPPAEPSHEPPVPERPLVVVLWTREDTRMDWVRAGMAMGAVLLRATAEGLVASPMTQVVEVERFRQRLRAELGLVGQPQVVLRLGYGQGSATTHRRPVDQVLEQA